jgi:hypothetical protein
MNTTTETHEPDFTPHEVAELYKVTVDQLRRWRHLKLGPPYRKLNQRVVRYPAKSTREFFDGCVVN